jgi:SAM-dependent methyltransferase
MFRDYSEIFDRRGRQYHEAMQRFPEARSLEFRTAISFLDVKPSHRVLDVPSGGSYVAPYLHPSVDLVSVETSAVFVGMQPEKSVLCSTLDLLPFPNGHFDRTMSIAGVHHIEDRAPLYRELFRTTQPGGVVVLADVASGSDVDFFLNTFVNKFNSGGHQGLFLTEADEDCLRSTGFDLVRADEKYDWTFPTTDALAEFCLLLFGLDLATPDDVIAGVREYVGLRQTERLVGMQWGLRFLQLRRPPN